VWTTVCEDTDGDGLGNPGSEQEICAESDSGRSEPADGCEIDDFTLYLSGSEVFYHSSEDIAGFQFNVDGATVSGGSGGDAGANGFTISAGGSTVLGFNFGGGIIPASCGTLTELSLSGDATGLSNIVVADTNAEGIPFSYYVPDSDEIDLVTDCSDDYPDCGSNVLDCAGVCDGDAVEDECGVCGGSGIPGELCDCDGNILDCAGECGGAATEDECGVCNIWNNDKDCNGDCFGTAFIDECEICSEGNRIMRKIVIRTVMGTVLECHI
jgi:hypothetical protein